MRKYWSKCLFVVVALLVMFSIPIGEADAASNNRAQVNYLALGDSLAAGVTPTNELGEGYTDFIAEEILGINAFQSFNKGFSSPGYTTTQVLQDILDNTTKPIYNLAGLQEETIQIQTAIANANIITISAGANDVLQNVDINQETGEVAVDQAVLRAKIAEVSSNMRKIIQQINTINPEAKIYVMGYYNPFPYLSADKQGLLNLLANQLNNAISGSLNNTATFVPTMNAIASNAKTYIPNPENIHLSQAGYEKVSDLFWNSMAGYKWITNPTFSDVKENWAQLFVEESFDKELIKGYPNGTFQPYTPLTRAHAASILVRALDLEATKKAPFTDIGVYDEATQMEISAAYEAGLIKGYDNNSLFKPTAKINRSQIALMIKRSFEYMEGTTITNLNDHPFTDLSTIQDEETLTSIAFLAQHNIISGSNGKFMPWETTLRQQAAKIFVNTVDTLHIAK